MAVSNGQVANATSFNNGLLGRNTDDNTTGKIDLLNTDSTNLIDIQSNINGNAVFLGRTVNSGATSGPVWTSATVGLIGNNVFERVDAITEEFNDLRPYVVDASVSESGLVNTGTQSFAGDKTFTGDISANNLSGTNTGDITLANIGSTPSADGASLSGQELTLQPADATFGGVLTAIAQTIAGLKTFAGGLVAQVSSLLEGTLSYDSETDSTSTGANATLGTPAKTIVRLTNASLTSVEGITAPTTNQVVTIINDTGNAIEILNLTGTAANQIDTGSADDLELIDGAAATLIYDLAGTKWRVAGGAGGGGAGGGLPVRDTFTGTSITTTEDARQVWVYTGGSAQVLSSISTGVVADQAEVEITGSDNTNTITVSNDDSSGGIIVNGTWIGYLYSKLVLRWDATLDRWIEVSRNGL